MARKREREPLVVRKHTVPFVGNLTATITTGPSEDQVLNMDLADFAQWVRTEAELPPGADIFEDEIAHLHELFRLLASIIRDTHRRRLKPATVAELNSKLNKLLVDLRIIPHVVSAGIGERPDAIEWTPRYLTWRVTPDGDATFAPPHVVTALIHALETLVGQYPLNFGVCDAPAPRKPEQRCDRIFERRRSDKRYCSRACSERARDASRRGKPVS